MAKHYSFSPRPLYRKSRWLSTNTSRTNSISCITSTKPSGYCSHSWQLKDHYKSLSITYSTNSEAARSIRTTIKNLLKAIDYIKNTPDNNKTKTRKKFVLTRFQGYEYSLHFNKQDGDIIVSFTESVECSPGFHDSVDLVTSEVDFCTEGVIYNTFYHKREHIVKLLKSIAAELMLYVLWINKQKKQSKLSK